MVLLVAFVLVFGNYLNIVKAADFSDRAYDWRSVTTKVLGSGLGSHLTLWVKYNENGTTKTQQIDDSGNPWGTVYLNYGNITDDSSNYESQLFLVKRDYAPAGEYYIWLEAKNDNRGQKYWEIGGILSKLGQWREGAMKFVGNNRQNANIVAYMEKINPSSIQVNTEGEFLLTEIQKYLNGSGEIKIANTSVEGELDYYSLPQECKDMVIRPISSENFKPLEELNARIKTEGTTFENPFRNKSRDEEIYRLYYSDFTNLNDSKLYPNKHFLYSDFLQSYQDTVNSVESIPFELISKNGDNWFSETASKYFSNPLLVAGGTAGAAKFLDVSTRTGAKIVDGLKSNRFWSVAKPPINPEDLEWARFHGYATGDAAAGGTAAGSKSFATASPGVWVLIGITAITITQMGVDQYKNKIRADANEKYFELITALMYAKHHIAFHECVTNAGITQAGFTQAQMDNEKKNLAMADKLATQLGSELSGYNEELDEGCPKAGMSVSGAILNAFCVVITMIQGLAKPLLTGAKAMLFMALGLHGYNST